MRMCSLPLLLLCTQERKTWQQKDGTKFVMWTFWICEWTSMSRTSQSKHVCVCVSAHWHIHRWCGYIIFALSISIIKNCQMDGDTAVCVCARTSDATMFQAAALSSVLNGLIHWLYLSHLIRNLTLSLNMSRVSIKFGRPLLWARFTCFTSYIGCGMPNATSMEPVRSCADWSTAEKSPSDYTVPPLTIIIINYLCKWNYSNSIFFVLFRLRLMTKERISFEIESQTKHKEVNHKAPNSNGPTADENYLVIQFFFRVILDT